MLCFTACDNSEEELELLRTEYAKYDPYEELVDALAAEDYAKVDALIDGYKAASRNDDLMSSALQEIVITADNWSDYFTIEEITEWTENDMGEAEGFITHVCVVLKDKYADAVDDTQTDVSFKWQATCSVKNCDVDLDNRMVAFENVFKSNSTTFGDPEVLTDTVSFDGTFVSVGTEDASVAAEISEIVIIGEYSLDGAMKPVCYDFDDTTIIDAEGILTIRNIGE